MMHINGSKFFYLKSCAIIIMIIVITAAFIKTLQLGDTIQRFSEDIISETAREDIYKLIIDKAVPVLDVCINENSDRESYEFIKSVLYKYFSVADFKNPRTYLASEIPLLGLVDITSFTGSVGGASSRSESTGEVNSEDNSEKNTEVPKPEIEVSSRGNFPDNPLENVKLDYDNPAVIVYHTHTTESFLPTPQNYYEMMGDHRTTDRNFNICRVGKEFKDYLETYYGYAVHHDMTLHDYPYYAGSYDRSKPTAEKLLKKYPDARFIIDMHRDAFPDDDTARVKMVTNIRGDQAAKIMFVIGKSNPHWQENYYLALKINQKLEELYPTLTKEILVKERSIYNQDISNKSLLIEIGAECNTLEEALISSKMVAKAIGEILKAEEDQNL